MSSLSPASPPSESPPALALPSPLQPPPKEIITAPPAPLETPSSPSPPSPPSSHHSPGGKSPVSHLPPPPPPPPSLSLSSISDSLPKPVIVGIAVGALVVAVGITILFICCGKRRKRRGYKSWGDEERSLSPPMPPPKDDSFSVPLQKWKQYVPPYENQVLKVPEQPSPPPLLASYPPPKPQPQSVYSNRGTSGSNSSGSDISLPPPAPTFAFGFSKNTFTYEELAMASDGFSEANLLGQGGFGYVHKGTLLNGKEVAIKQLKTGSGQGEREFRAEVEIISRVHHKHLVSLVGYCISGGKRLLIYEYVQNNTMEFHLHGTNTPTMGWPTRLKIALGSAKGLAYLHEDCNPKIIHRDIKAANILLDYNFEAKVADFGLAKFASDKNTHISTRVMGTFGYLAPEYASTGKLTHKSDVFSYGVMLLELITGRQPVSTSGSLDESLVDWARPLMTRAIENGYYDDLVDPRLGRNYSNKEMKRMIACASSCVRHSARCRPRMSQVLRAMEGGVSLEDLNEGIQPGHSRMDHDSYSSSDYDSQKCNEALQKFRKMALQTQVYASSEYSAATSEYGLFPSTSSSEGQNTREMEMKNMKNIRSFGSSHGFSTGL